MSVWSKEKLLITIINKQQTISNRFKDTRSQFRKGVCSEYSTHP